jgi:hypothetical protein
MRVARLLLSVIVSFLISISLAAQQTATSSPQALVLLQQSLSALAGGQTLNDVTLSGTARRIAGSDDETGTAVLKALASGPSRVDLTLPSGQRSEVCNLSATPPAGSWSGPDGIGHPIAFHNLLSEPAWFFPAFAITRRLSTSGYVAIYIGQEAHNDQAVERISVLQTSSAQFFSSDPSFPHLTQVEFFLDSTTLLPAALAFNIHPDNNELVDIPVEVRFSDYRPINCTQVPFHVQKLINNSLILDFQAQTVTPSSGLTASTFTAAAGLQPGSSSVAAASRSSEAMP